MSAADGDVERQQKRKPKRRLLISVIIVLFVITFVSIAIGASIFICDKLHCNGQTENAKGTKEKEDGNTEELIHWILNGGNKIQNTTSLNMNFENSNLTDAWKHLHTNGCKLNNTGKRLVKAIHDHIHNFVSGQEDIEILNLLDKNCLKNKKNKKKDNSDGRIENIIKHNKKSII